MVGVSDDDEERSVERLRELEDRRLDESGFSPADDEELDEDDAPDPDRFLRATHPSNDLRQ